MSAAATIAVLNKEKINTTSLAFSTADHGMHAPHFGLTAKN
jgi:hypothetical protein